MRVIGILELSGDGATGLYRVRGRYRGRNHQ